MREISIAMSLVCNYQLIKMNYFIYQRIALVAGLESNKYLKEELFILINSYLHEMIT